MDIEIYTTQGCQYCAAAKRLLDKRGVAYREIDLGDDAELARRFGTGTRPQTAPQIFVDGQHIGGFDELVELDQDGKLA